VGLARKLLCVPTGSDSLFSVTLVHSNNIDHLVLSENVSNWDLFLEETTSVVDLGGNVSTIDLDFHHMSFLLSQRQKFHLSMCDNTDDFAVLLQLVEVSVKLFLTFLILPFAARLGESLLLGVVPDHKKAQCWREPVVSSSYRCKKSGDFFGTEMKCYMEAQETPIRASSNPATLTNLIKIAHQSMFSHISSCRNDDGILRSNVQRGWW